MTFITSKDTIESLMGPAIRTQATTPSISPRQSRIRAAGIRSASETTLALTKEPSLLPPTGRTTSESPSRANFARRSSLPDLTLIHPQAQFAYSQQSANLLDPASLHSQPRRRRKRQSMYNSSIDLSSKHSLAPVIENDMSPTEEDSQTLSINFSHPVYGLYPVETSIDNTKDNIESSKNSILEENDTLLDHALLGDHDKSAHLVELEASSLVRDLYALKYDPSSAMPLASMSSPELTCSSSLSSTEDDSASRSSISSASSIEDAVDGSETSVKSQKDRKWSSLSYAAYAMDGIVRKSNNSSPTILKVNKLLGPESPTLSTANEFMFETSPSADRASRSSQLSRDSNVVDTATNRKTKLNTFGMFTAKSWTRKNKSSTALA